MKLQSLINLAQSALNIGNGERIHLHHVQAQGLQALLHGRGAPGKHHVGAQVYHRLDRRLPGAPQAGQCLHRGRIEGKIIHPHQALTRAQGPVRETAVLFCSQTVCSQADA